MKIGSLFSGYGGLDLGVQAVLGGEVAWHVEFDDAPSKILDHRFPGVPNYGDITAVDWSTVEPVDVLTGGFPCQDVSLAGLRRGLKDGTRSGLWSHFAVAIDKLRPQLVVIENVRGLLSAEADRGMESDPWTVGNGDSRPTLRALGAVLGDLADLGYDARWCGVRAADAGAPHERFRVFVVAYPCGGDLERRGAVGVVGGASAAGAGIEEERERIRDSAVGCDSAIAAHPAGGRCDRRSSTPVRCTLGRTATPGSGGGSVAWGAYEPAIRRWESALGRVAPYPVAGTGKRGEARHTAEFVEWMMGLPAGWVTAHEMWTHLAREEARKAQLTILGNGVVPQQATLAVAALLPTEAVAA